MLHKGRPSVLGIVRHPRMRARTHASTHERTHKLARAHAHACTRTSTQARTSHRTIRPRMHARTPAPASPTTTRMHRGSPRAGAAKDAPTRVPPPRRRRTRARTRRQRLSAGVESGGSGPAHRGRQDNEKIDEREPFRIDIVRAGLGHHARAARAPSAALFSST